MAEQTIKLVDQKGQCVTYLPKTKSSETQDLPNQYGQIFTPFSFETTIKKEI